jgi:hypothetical protein
LFPKPSRFKKPGFQNLEGLKNLVSKTLFPKPSRFPKP